MIKMTYSDWLYEYERCYDLFEKTGIHFYCSCMDILELYYPVYYDIWLEGDDEVEIKSDPPRSTFDLSHKKYDPEIGQIWSVE